MIISIPRDTVPEGMTLSPGIKVPLSNGMMALVLEVNDKEIKLDANHELAGKALTFDMELVGFQDTVLGSPQAGLKRAVFGLGCFWGKLSSAMRAMRIGDWGRFAVAAR